jgi:pimeloyl-ACP methyl ester carboxylesterase
MRLLSALIAATLVTAAGPALAQQSADMEAPGPHGPLAGTLLTAEGPGAPIMLILPGSGPTDRDGNSPLGVAAAPYRLLAEGLAQRGVTTIRIDKRGMFGSRGAAPDPNAVTVGDYVEDVRSWIASARQWTGASCIWLLGHSEGALIALAAGQEPAGICGLVLVAGAGRPMGEVMRGQLRANPANAPLLDQALAAIDRLEAGGRVDAAALNPALAPLFAPQVQRFLISLFAQDPAGLVGRVRRPVLIVQGERDIQVPVDDAQRLAAANPRATLVLVPNANHVLKSVATDDRTANVATYGDPTLPLAPGIVDGIAEFVVARPQRR